MAKNEDHQPQWITCPTCGGSGYTSEQRPVQRGGKTTVEWHAVECKQCDSSGLVRK